MEKWIDVTTGIEYEKYNAYPSTGHRCWQCDISSATECGNFPCSKGKVLKETGNVYPNLQQAVDDLLDYLSSLPELPPFAGDEQKEEMIKKFVHLKSTKD